ncbi:unnamed protein product, partial [Dracunculus medinensis]|uniref:Endo/exonuclease/phosphatase domain-containing protein n=1 Tax=Dracunculus medinensis TaxID=318479 RepID=A0A0N4URN5_DRAME
MAPKKVAVYGAVSNNDVSCLNKTIEDLRSQLASITEKYEKQDLIVYLTRYVEILRKHLKIETEQVLEIIEEYFEKKEKEPCLVGIKIPEKSTDDGSTTADRLLAENILAAAGLLLIDKPNSIFCTSETWLDDSIDNRELNFDGFIVSRVIKDRTINSSNIRGGGLTMLIPDYYKFITFDDYVCSSFESLIIKIYLSSKNISLSNLYRPPGYGSKFTRDLYNLLLRLKLIGTDYVIVGDLNMPNINWEKNCLKSSNKFEEDFLNFCTYVGLQQHVKVATRYNTILDIVLAAPTSLVDKSRRNQLRSWWGNRSSNARTRGLFSRRHQKDYKISAKHFFRTPKSHKRSDIVCIDESLPEIILNGVHWRFPNAKRKADKSDDEPAQAKKKLMQNEKAMYIPIKSGCRFAILVKQLKSLLGRICEQNCDKYFLLEERDKILHKARIKSNDVERAVTVQGTCEDMCSEKERYARIVQKRVSPYECNHLGEMIPKIAVKEYRRSAADQEEPLPHELRPIHVLHSTMNYLIEKIASNIPSRD